MPRSAQTLAARLRRGNRMQLAYLALGSNRGSRRRHLREAVLALAQLPGTRLRGVSELYETDFVGQGEQDRFLNACVVVETELSPEELLGLTQKLEREAGREPDTHMRPRSLDIDLLVHGDSRRDGERLQLPHPRMGERRFVLEPLCDLDPGLTPPGMDRSVREMLAQPGLASQEVRELAGVDWWEEEA